MTADPVGDGAALTLRADDGATATVLLHGAHVTSWRTADGVEQLYLSERARFDGSAVRGGVPVIFPQFAAEGPYPRHGFARTTRWALAGGEPAGTSPWVLLRLHETPETLAVWPHRFVAELRVDLGQDGLAIALEVANPGTAPIEFTAALHTYLAVGDYGSIEIDGLQGLAFRDSTAGGTVRRQEEPVLRPGGELNRIYLDAAGPVTVREDGRTRIVSMSGFRDVVAWNPGPAAATTLDDMEPGGWTRMLCVEAAAIARPVVVDAGRRWRGAQRLAVR